jgi:NADH-quinone oxidoreductase subunit M
MPGIPGNGFVGEFTILWGVFQLPDKYWAVLAATGIVLGAVYMLWLYQRTMFGKLDNPDNAGLADLDLREILTLLPLIVLSFWIGLYPKPMFDVLQEPVERIVRQVDGTYEYPEAVRAMAPHAYAARIGGSVSPGAPR